MEKVKSDVLITRAKESMPFWNHMSHEKIQITWCGTCSLSNIFAPLY